MECDRAQELLPGYLDGSLTPEERGDAERHIGECSRCAAEERALNETLALLRNLPTEKAPPELLEGVRRGIALLENARAPARDRFFRSARFRIPLEAAAAVALVLLLYGIQSRFPLEDRRPSPSRVESASTGEETAGEAGSAPATQPERVAAGESASGRREAPDRAAAAPEAAGDGAAPSSAGEPAETESGRFPSREIPAEEAFAVRIPRAEHGATEGRTRRSLPSSPPAGLPVVPATRVSSGAEPIRPQFSGERRETSGPAPPTLEASPARLQDLPVSGREVRIEVVPQDRHGLEARIETAAVGLGGTVRRDAERPVPPAGLVAAAEPEDFIRVRIPAESEKEFLAELRKLGTIAEEALPPSQGVAEAEAPPSVAYTVWIRVR